jgi:hypothetical protein
MSEVKKRTYEVFGFYKFYSKHNFFTGEFDIDSDDLIRGKIWDPNSRCSEHQVEGKVEQEDKGSAVILKFVKIPTGMLVNIYYYFKKTAIPTNKLKGEYDGYWTFKEKVIPIRKRGVPIMGKADETGGKSRITLKEK